MNGMELAATIRTYLPGALIIFITAYTKYALDAFELSAFRYIDKEMLPEKLPTAIRDAFRILHMQTEYGGAPMLGLKGLVVKTHGSATSKEIKHAIFQCTQFSKERINEKIKEHILEETN